MSGVSRNKPILFGFFWCRRYVLRRRANTLHYSIGNDTKMSEFSRTAPIVISDPLMMLA